MIPSFGIFSGAFTILNFLPFYFRREIVFWVRESEISKRFLRHSESYFFHFFHPGREKVPYSIFLTVRALSCSCVSWKWFVSGLLNCSKEENDIFHLHLTCMMVASATVMIRIIVSYPPLFAFLIDELHLFWLKSRRSFFFRACVLLLYQFSKIYKSS